MEFFRARRIVSARDVLIILTQTLKLTPQEAFIHLGADKREAIDVSDIHGSLSSVFTIFDIAGRPSLPIYLHRRLC
jgi:hypothetical protein